MNEKFMKHVVALDAAYSRLVEMAPVYMCALPKAIPAAGVYLFSEQSQAMYVGRTNRMRPRLQEHCRISSPHNAAPFAFRLARETTGRTDASYRRAGSRTQLERDPDFKIAFERAKDRVREMEVRFVAELDPLRQGLLEVYVAFVVGAKYNDFDTH
jgi:hypothetical protein